MTNIHYSAEASKPLPKASPLPPLPDTDLLSTEQWSILSAIADTVVPSFTACKGNRLLQHPLRRESYEAVTRRLEQLAQLIPGDELVSRYLGESATAQPEFRDNVSRLLAYYINDEARSGLMKVLSLLNTRIGALLLTGYATPLDCLPVATREAILQGWATARLPILRSLHRSLTMLIKVNWIRTSPTLGPVLGFPRIPVNVPTPKSTGFPFHFLQIPPSSTSPEPEPEIIETDVVIIGSGCGGAVAAKTLSESGLKVIVVDKSYYWPPSHFPMTENDAAIHLFENGGAITSDDTTMTSISGSTWGGGGTINWSASLQTQGYVRREWAQKYGLKYFTSSGFQADLDAVCERMGVGTEAIVHNKTNRVLLEGARKLGWSAKVVPQNTGGEAHSCGYCTLGCGSCGKKGPIETFLPDAAIAGATFVEGFDVREVLFEGDTAVGVKGIWTSRDSNGGVSGSDRSKRDVIIKAKNVVLSAGTLSTPLLLRRSGIQNRHIGRHLQLHPASLLAAAWEEDIKPWEGPILTAVINEFENLDGDGYGTKLEATTMLPGWFLTSFPWQSGLQWKAFAAKMARMTGYISLVRPRHTGIVYPDPIDGRCRIRYSTSTYDREHVLEGIARLAELVYVEGAVEIHTAVPGLEPFVRPTTSSEEEPGSKVHVTKIPKPSSNDAEFQSWLARMRKIGFPSPDSAFAAAHQMGTCRMGTKFSNSAVDAKGRVWDTNGLYICDASVFPSASGVNPMITNMAISRMTARGMVDSVATMKARL